MDLLQSQKVVLGDGFLMAESQQLTEAFPGEIKREQLKAIKSVLEPGETIEATATAFSVEFNCYNEAVGACNTPFWMPRVHHHWVAVTDYFLRVGDFAMYELPESRYRDNRRLWNWWKIISYRSHYLTMPAESSDEIIRHTFTEFGSISKVHSDTAGTAPYVFDGVNLWEWRWVLDANGFESQGKVNSDGSWQSPMPLLALNRLSYTAAGHDVDLFSFHPAVNEIGKSLRTSIKPNSARTNTTKPKRNRGHKSRSDSDAKDSAILDVKALSKLAELHKSGALTDEEFKRAKESLLR